MAKEKLLEALKLWKSLGDVPIDKDECIETSWHTFPAGTNRYIIWGWFEWKFEVSVALDLMGISQK